MSYQLTLSKQACNAGLRAIHSSSTIVRIFYQESKNQAEIYLTGYLTQHEKEYIGFIIQAEKPCCVLSFIEL